MKPTTGTTILYHVTPSYNSEAIEVSGILPAFARRAHKASWYVKRSRIQWAILHVSNIHCVAVSDISVCAVLVEWKNMKRSGKEGMYYTYVIYRVESVCPASQFIEAELEEERYDE